MPFSGSGVAAARMVEREGIEHDVYAETQIHSDVLNLDDYRGLILGSAEEHLVSS